MVSILQLVAMSGMWFGSTANPLPYEAWAGAKRRKTSLQCACPLNWEYGHFRCLKKYEGCCNPLGDSDGPFCPVVATTHWPQPTTCQRNGTFDKCSPLSWELFDICAPWWYLGTGSECPFGTALWHVTLPIEGTIWDYIWFIYGFVPYFLVFSMLAEFLAKRNSQSLYFLTFQMFSSASTELCLKRLILNPRPPRTCLHTCGMPSGHSTISIGYFTLMLIHASLRLRADRALQDVDLDQPREKCCCRVTCVFRSAAPILRKEFKVNVTCFMMWVLLWSLVLLPVPFSRTRVHDHTPAQVLVGSFIGILEALVWFRLFQCFERRSKRLIGHRRFGILHDYALPANREDMVDVELSRDDSFPFDTSTSPSTCCDVSPTS